MGLFSRHQYPEDSAVAPQTGTHGYTGNQPGLTDNRNYATNNPSDYRDNRGHMGDNLHNHPTGGTNMASNLPGHHDHRDGVGNQQYDGRDSRGLLSNEPIGNRDRRDFVGNNDYDRHDNRGIGGGNQYDRRDDRGVVGSNLNDRHDNRGYVGNNQYDRRDDRDFLDKEGYDRRNNRGVVDNDRRGRYDRHDEYDPHGRRGGRRGFTFFRRHENRRDRRDTSPGREKRNKRALFDINSGSFNRRPSFGQWLKFTLLDIITMIIMGAIGLGVYFADPAPSRSFPITFTDGEIVFPQFAYPLRHEIIPIWEAALLASLVPIAVILLMQIRIRSFWDVNNAVIGLLYSLISAAVFQVFVKWLIGGLRPHFLYVCAPDLSKVISGGQGYQQIMFQRDVCTGDKNQIDDSLESMPSGHSTAAFAGFMFLYFYLNAKLKVFANYHPAMWKIIAVYAPVLGACLIAGTLTIDEYHNWYDCLAGAIIGSVMAISAYRMVYASVWDFRFNHIPLTRHTPFSYGAGEAGAGGFEAAVWTRKAGWGFDEAYGGAPFDAARHLRGTAMGFNTGITGNSTGVDGHHHRGGHGFGHGNRHGHGDTVVAGGTTKTDHHHGLGHHDDRTVDHQHGGIGHHGVDNRNVDNRGIGHHGVDDRVVDNRGIGNRGVDDRVVDNRGVADDRGVVHQGVGAHQGAGIGHHQGVVDDEYNRGHHSTATTVPGTTGGVAGGDYARHHPTGDVEHHAGSVMPVGNDGPGIMRSGNTPGSETTRVADPSPGRYSQHRKSLERKAVPTATNPNY